MEVSSDYQSGRKVMESFWKTKPDKKYCKYRTCKRVAELGTVPVATFSLKPSSSISFIKHCENCNHTGEYCQLQRRRPVVLLNNQNQIGTGTTHPNLHSAGVDALLLSRSLFWTFFLKIIVGMWLVGWQECSLCSLCLSLLALVDI